MINVKIESPSPLGILHESPRITPVNPEENRLIDEFRSKC